MFFPGAFICPVVTHFPPSTLLWTINVALLTSREVKSATFIVQRRVDGGKWVTTGQIKAPGKNISRSDYSHTDLRPMKGINYYRIKQVGISGKVYYSKVKT